jgi:hypothetical protein
MIIRSQLFFPPSGSKDFVFSEVAFDRDQVNSSCSPCSDFFVRSWHRHKSLMSGSSDSNPTAKTDSRIKRADSPQLDSAILLKLTLVFLWKAYVVQESGQMKIVVGQHHVHIDRLNTVSVSYPIPPTVTVTPPLKFTRDLEPEEKPPPDPAVTTRLVSYSFSHSNQKEHSFSKGICIVPVGLISWSTQANPRTPSTPEAAPQSLSNGSASTRRRSP